MKKSRLGLFKSTSMLITILGIIMVVSTIAVVAYVGFSWISSDLTGGVSSGAQYDEFNELKANYSSLAADFENVRASYYVKDNPDLQQKYVDAEVYLVHAKNALDDVESALSMGKSSSEVESRMNEAKIALNNAKSAYNTLN